MVEDINKKISIDVEIGNDGQQQINQYNLKQLLCQVAYEDKK